MIIGILSDPPKLFSGQARVVRELGRGLEALGHTIFSVSWLAPDYTDFDPSVMWGEYKLIYGYGEIINNLNNFIEILKDSRIEVLICVGDLHHFTGLPIVKSILASQQIRLKLIGYINVDCLDLPSSKHAIAETFDHLIATSEFGAGELEKLTGRKYEFAHHGVNTAVFQPIDMTERTPCPITESFPLVPKSSKWNEYFKILLVGRNTWRKGLCYLLKAIAATRSRCPRLLCIIVTDPQDGFGMPLVDMVRLMKIDDVVSFVEARHDHPVFDAELNILYNRCDYLIQPSLGEGFGLPIIESMAAGTPVIATDNSAMTELIPRNTGRLIPIAEHTWSYDGNKLSIINTNMLANALIEFYNLWQSGSPKILKTRINCVEFAKTKTWDNLIEKMNSAINTPLQSNRPEPAYGMVNTGLQFQVTSFVKSRGAYPSDAIAILKFGGIGDNIQLTPIITGVRRKYPDRKIFVMVEEGAIVLVNNRNVEATIELGKSLDYGSVCKSLGHLFYRFYDIRYVSTVYGEPETDFFTQHRWFYDNWALSNSRIESLNTHVIDLMLKSTGLDAYASIDDLHITPEPLVGMNSIPNENYVVMHNHAGSIGGLKVAPTGYVNQIAGWFIKHGYAVVQLGTLPSSKIHPNVIDLRNRLRPLQSAQVLHRAKLYFGVEGGLFHMAKAVGTPGMVYFLATPAAAFAYQDTIVLSNESCKPCWWSSYDWRSKCLMDQIYCMNLPTLEETITQLEMWQESNKSHSPVPNYRDATGKSVRVEFNVSNG